MTTTTIKVGQMPGRIQEFVVDSGASFKEVIALAELSATGFEVKADGAKIENLDASVGTTNLVLLAKQVKGNASRTVKVGVMPGRIQEFAVDSDDSIETLIALAELSTSGYEVKIDGNKVTDFSQPVGSANLVLLAKQVKGNK
jgi:hypothetical protein